MTRLLGIDHGSRRIGIAVGDSETGMAFARRALQRRGGDGDIAALSELARAEEVSLVVIGLPMNMDGSEGSQAAAARAFGERLAAIGLRIVYADERLSSWEAGVRLAEAGNRPSRRSGDLDSAAARLILQQYLDAPEGV
jgi:putative Holliday junction resolvase